MNTSSDRQKRKLRVGVVFGGRSVEHEVSLVSAASIMNALDRQKYDVIPIGITPEGKWLKGSGVLELFRAGERKLPGAGRILPPDPTVHGLLPELRSSGRPEMIDVIIPVVHGTYGEDGTIQGLFDLAGIPYVGAGVLGSSVGMDKVVTKQLCERSGIPVVPYTWFLAAGYKRDPDAIDAAIRRLGFPLFIKPANGGSSVGISKVKRRAELRKALALAMRYDRKILVEQAIPDAREIEVSVLGNDEPEASVPGEIISSNEFYDYDAKYVDGRSQAIIPAVLPASTVRRLRAIATGAFRAIDCSGMARVDFLVPRHGRGRVYLNEINTIPGFTSISMYPKLWEASGVPYPKLLDRLIALAIRRRRERDRLQTTFTPRAEWYKG